MDIAIVGGGMMGISLGYFLSRQGVNVEIFEASPELGGLAGPILLEDGVAIDRFYHAILSSDHHLIGLCKELGIDELLRFRETKMGFYHRGRVHSMNNLAEFLRFPPLGWLDRFRLGWTVLYAQFVRDWRRLENVSVEDWLVGLSGRRTYENIWRPMLMAKFDGGFENTPATYIWSRLVRMKSTRDGASQKEKAGHLIGGYFTLVMAMARSIEAGAGQIHRRQPVEEIMIQGGKAWGIRLGSKARPFDAVVATVQAPLFRRLIPDADQAYLDFLAHTEYLGIIAPVLVLDRPLTGFWTLNITDDGYPFTGVIETTAYIDPEYVGSHHLVYLPKYTAPGSPWQDMLGQEVQERWLQNLRCMFPHFDRRWVKYFLVQRERYVEPLHGLDSTSQIPPIQTPAENLYYVTTAQIYPGLTNGESVTRHARHAAGIVLQDRSRMVMSSRAVQESSMARETLFATGPSLDNAVR